MHPDFHTLERLVDARGLQNVLEILADICGEKSAHLQGNWQDEDAARAWARAGRVLERAVIHPAVAALARSYE